MMNRELEGRIAIITGSTQGLGAAIARMFVEHGAKVVITGRTDDKGTEVAAALGSAAFFHRADLAKVEDCKALVDATLKKFGAVDIIINSAADTSRANLDTVTPEFFDRLFAINVRAPVFIAQAALPSLRERNGVIINIGSVNAYIGLPNLLVYAATKGALMTMTKNLSNALARDRVRAFCLNVGWMETEGEYAVLAKEGRANDFIKNEGSKLPIGRLIQPKEVADVCLFLASQRTQVFSGAVIDLEQFPVGALSYAAGEDVKK